MTGNSHEFYSCYLSLAESAKMNIAASVGLMVMSCETLTHNTKAHLRVNGPLRSSHY